MSQTHTPRVQTNTPQGQKQSASKPLSQQKHNASVEPVENTPSSSHFLDELDKLARRA